MLLENRVAFITGAGSGIGAAGAKELARQGATVVVTDRDSDAAQDLANTITKEGYVADALQLDVTNDAAIASAIAETARKHGRLDVLHSHAGIQVEGKLEQVAVADMDASWALNVRAHFVAAKAALAPMRKQGGGSVIITSSNSGVFYDHEMIAYSTTKHAVIAMTRQMAIDYGKHTVRFNALCPGWVDTPFNEPYIKQMGGRKVIEKYVQEHIPMGRWAEPGEIAEGILFLASDRSSFMTGHALVIDGGECIF